MILKKIIYLILIVIAFSDLHAKKTIKVDYKQSELYRIYNQEQFIKLNNLILDVDTENKLLKERIHLQSDAFKKSFDVQQKYYETVLKQQTKIYDTELGQQTLIYGIAFGGLTIIAFILNLIGFNKLKKYTNKIVKSEHDNAIIEITSALSESDSLKKLITSLVKIEAEKQGGLSFEKDIS